MQVPLSISIKCMFIQHQYTSIVPHSRRSYYVTLGLGVHIRFHKEQHDKQFLITNLLLGLFNQLQARLKVYAISLDSPFNAKHFNTASACYNRYPLH